MTSRRHLSGRERPDHRTVFSGKSFAERLSWHHVMRLDPRLRNSTSGFSSPPLPRIGRTSDPVRRSRGVQQFFRPGARLPLPSFQCLSLTRGLDFSNTALDLGSSTCITVLDSFLHQSRCPQGENLLPSPSAAKSAPKRLTSLSDQHRGDCTALILSQIFLFRFAQTAALGPSSRFYCPSTGAVFFHRRLVAFGVEPPSGRRTCNKRQSLVNLLFPSTREPELCASGAPAHEAGPALGPLTSVSAARAFRLLVLKGCEAELPSTSEVRSFMPTTPHVKPRMVIHCLGCQDEAWRPDCLAR